MGDPIKPNSVRVTGRYTDPPSFGVYELPDNCGAIRRYRFGNHPVRMQELQREFGNCTLRHLFLDREDARERALWLNCHRVIGRNIDARQKDLKQQRFVRKGKRLTDKPLKIEGEACGKRIVDSLYRAGDNYYFLDTGWIDTPTHPDHPIGKMVKAEKDRWEFMDDIKRLFVITPITDDDISWGVPMIEGYKRWKEYLKEKYPEANGADFIRRDLGLGDVEIEQVG